MIYTQWICQNCKSEFRNYVSFGEPVEDFDYKWKCKKCGHVNTLHVKAFNSLSEPYFEEYLPPFTPARKLKDCTCGGRPIKATTDLGSDFYGSCYGVYYGCEKCFAKTPPVPVRYNPYSLVQNMLTLDNESQAREIAERWWNEGVRKTGGK
jgi:hypothetical protein